MKLSKICDELKIDWDTLINLLQGTAEAQFTIFQDIRNEVCNKTCMHQPKF